MNRNTISRVEIWPADPEAQIRRECKTCGLARPVEFRAAKRANFDNLALLADLSDGTLFLLEHAPISGSASGVIVNRKRTPDELAFMRRYGIMDSAAAALGRMGGASTSPAKRAASRANGAKGGRPVKPAGEPHTWTMREVAAVMGDRSYTAPAGRGVFVRAACFPGEFEDSPAWFDLQPSWGDAIGPHDDCDATVDALVRRIAAKFPPAEGHLWQYNSTNGTIEQA